MATAQKRERFYGWILLPILCLIYSIPIGFALYGPPVIYPFMQKELHWQRGEINLGYTIIGIILGMGALLIPWMIGHFGPRKTLAIGFITIAIASFIMTLFGYLYPVYIVLCFLIGLGMAFSSVVPIQALVILWFNVHRALAMGIVMGGGAIGGFIYPQVISNVITNLGDDWRTGWVIIAVACFIGALIAIIGIRNSPEDLGQHPDGISPEQLHHAMQNADYKPIRTYRSSINWRFKDALKTHQLWGIVLSTGFIFFLWQVVLTQTPAHLTDQGFSPMEPSLLLQPSFIYGLILACSILGRLSLSFLGETLETRFIIAIAGFSVTIGGALFWFVSRDNLWAIYLYPLLAGFGFGATYVSVPLITGNYFGAGAFPSISAITQPIISIFQFSSPFIAGKLYDLNNNYGLAMLIACTVGLTGTLLILLCKPPEMKQAAKV